LLWVLVCLVRQLGFGKLFDMDLGGKFEAMVLCLCMNVWSGEVVH
jgi:hypothetical protein